MSVVGFDVGNFGSKVAVARKRGIDVLQVSGMLTFILFLCAYCYFFFFYQYSLYLYRSLLNNLLLRCVIALSVCLIE